MNNKYWKFAVLFAASLSLAACGGGGDDSSKTPGDQPPGNSEVIVLTEGEFKYTSVTGKDYQSTGYSPSTECFNEPRYFESENFMVFSGYEHSDDEIMMAATLAERELPKVLSNFNMSKADFIATKRRMNPYDLWQVTLRLVENEVIDPETGAPREILPTELSSYFDDKIPESIYQYVGSPSHPYNHYLRAYVSNALLTEPNGQVVVDVIKEAGNNLVALNGDSSLLEMLEKDPETGSSLIHSKIQICTTDDLYTHSSFNAYVEGIRLPPAAKPSDYHRELAHHVQFQFNPNMSPIWLREGQAAAFSGTLFGQSVDKSYAQEIDPTAVIDQNDEAAIATGIKTDYYDQYERAYLELADTNSVEKMTMWLRESLHLEPIIGSTTTTDYKENLKATFGEIMKDANNDLMSYEEFGNSL